MPFITPILILLLVPAGFIGSAWVTNSVLDYFRKDIDEPTILDQVGTLFLLTTLFGSYCYFINSFLPK